jgi:hypothetical protein
MERISVSIPPACSAQEQAHAGKNIQISILNLFPMIASSRVRFFVVVVATIICSHASAQTAFRQFSIKNPYPKYQLSTDGRTLAIYEKTEADKLFAIFLDLENYVFHPKASFVLENLTLTPDLKGAYGMIYSAEGFQGNEHWMAYKKYLSWYFPNNTEFTKKQWADQLFILGVRPDGMLVTAGSVNLKSKKKSYPELILGDVSIMDPASGQITETIRQGELIKAGLPLFTTGRPHLIDDGRLLKWDGNADHHYDGGTMNLRQGGIVSYSVPFSLKTISGKYIMGVTRLPIGELRDLDMRKIVVDLETGARVHDDTLRMRKTESLWCAAGNANTFYMLKAENAMLYKEEMTDGKLRVTDSLKLNIDGLFHVDYIQDPYTYSHDLIVSETLNRVLLAPVSWNNGDDRVTSLYMWDLRDGKLLHENKKFIQPYESFVAKNTRVYKAPVQVVVAPNILVVSHDYKLYHVVGKSPTGTLWSVIRFNKNDDGTYARYEELKSEFDLTYNAKYATPTTCQQCNGGGSTVSISQRTVEKTDKMIYNQITTTRTFEDRTSSACSACKGLGFTYRINE